MQAPSAPAKPRWYPAAQGLTLAPVPCRATGGDYAAWYGQCQMGAFLVNNGGWGGKCKITLWTFGKVAPLTPDLPEGQGGVGRQGPSALGKESYTGRVSPGLLPQQRHGKTAANDFSYNLANQRWDLCCLTIDLKGRQKNLCGSLQAFFSLCRDRILQQALLKPGLPSYT